MYVDFRCGLGCVTCHGYSSICSYFNPLPQNLSIWLNTSNLVKYKLDAAYLEYYISAGFPLLPLFASTCFHLATLDTNCLIILKNKD